MRALIVLFNDAIDEEYAEGVLASIEEIEPDAVVQVEHFTGRRAMSLLADGPPEMLEASAVMAAASAYAGRLGRPDPPASDLPKLLEELVTSSCRLQAVTR